MTSNPHDRQEAENWLLGIIERGQKTWGASRENVTPARAVVMLEHNPNNRNLKSSKADQYAADMAAGRYEADNGETIKLSIDGDLNDGQNRLAALVKTGMTFEMLIAFGLRRDSRFTVDIGAPRTVGDAISLQGHRHGTMVGAAARRILSYNLTGAFGNTGRVSATEAMTFGNNTPKLVEAVAWAANAAGHFRALKVPASEVARLFYMFDTIADKDGKGWARNFFNIMGVGTNLREGDALLTLRDALLKPRKRVMADRVELIIRAWNAWVRNEAASAQSIAVQGRLPDIKGPKRGQENVGIRG